MSLTSTAHRGKALQEQLIREGLEVDGWFHIQGLLGTLRRGTNEEGNSIGFGRGRNRAAEKAGTGSRAEQKRSVKESTVSALPRNRSPPGLRLY